MIATCRLWLKFVVAVALLIGCNVVAPAMSAAANVAVLTSDMPCHEHRGKSDAPPTTSCGKACLAIPVTASAIMASPSVTTAPFAAPLPVFTGQIASPDTPPPRSAQHA